MRIVAEDVDALLEHAVRRLGELGETWSTIPGTTLAAVSTAGRVMNVYRRRVLKPTVTAKGGLQVRVDFDGAFEYRFVHRLVAGVFLPNPDELPVVRHHDGQQSNNRLENLYWSSPQGTAHRPSTKTDEELLARAADSLTFTFDPDERWQLIPATSLYAISNQGRVLNVHTRRLLQPGRDQSGHLHVAIRIAGVMKSPSVHRLVAAAFLPNPCQHPIVRHLDDDKWNNTVNNLRWGTHEDNLADMIRNHPAMARDLRGHHGMLLPADLIDLIGDRDWLHYVNGAPAVLEP